jgi:hypothetical protein
MSRINIQTGLSGSPGLPTGLGSINPGSFTPVVDTTAGDVLNLVRGAIGVATQVNQQNVQQRETKIAEDYEMSSANLIRLREQAGRDPSYESSFLNAYKSAQERFKGTKYEADVESAGAPVVTAFQDRANRIAETSARGFFETRVVTQARQRIQESFDSFAAIEDPYERQLEIERTIREMIPPNLFSYLGEQADAAIQSRVAAEAISVNNSIQSQVDREIAAQRKNNTDLALSSATAQFGKGGIALPDLLRNFDDMNPADKRGNESRLVSDLAVMAEGTRDFDELATLASQFNKIVRSGEIQFSETKTAAFRALEATTERMAEIDSDGIRTAWMNVYNDPDGPQDMEGRVASANIAAEDYVINRLSSPSLYGADALRDGPIGNLPREGSDGTMTFRGAYLEALRDTLKQTTVELADKTTAKDRSILANLSSGTGKEFAADDAASSNLVNNPIASVEALNQAARSVGMSTNFGALIGNPEVFFSEAGRVEARAALNAHGLPGSQELMPLLKDRLLSNGPEFNWGVGFLNSVQASELKALLAGGGLDAAEAAAMQDIWVSLRSDNTNPAQLRQAYSSALQRYNETTIAEAQRVLDPKEAFKTIESYSNAIKKNAQAVFAVDGSSTKIEAVTPSYMTQVGIRAAAIQRNSTLDKTEAVKLAVAQLRTQGYVEVVHGDGALDAVFDPERQLPESYGLPRQDIINRLLSDKTQTEYARTLSERLGYPSLSFRDSVGSFILNNKLVDATGLSPQTIGRELGKGLMLRFDNADTQDTNIGMVVEGVIQSVDGSYRYISVRLDTAEEDGFVRNIFRGAREAVIVPDISALKSVREAKPSLGGTQPAARPASLSPRREQDLNTLSGPELLGQL